MLKIGKLRLDGVPRVAVSVADGVPPASIKALRKAGIDLIELRIDRFSSFKTEYVLKEITKYSAFPVLATIRSKKEGGLWERGESERLALFKSILPSVAAIDMELESVTILKETVRLAKKARKLVILSYHDFKKMPKPGELEQLLNKAKSSGADIVKIAVFAKNDQDVERLADFTFSHRSKGLITIAMGDRGAVSRLLFPGLGSLITFACLDKAGAPGQMDWRLTTDTLRELYPKYRVSRPSR